MNRVIARKIFPAFAGNESKFHFTAGVAKQLTFKISKDQSGITFLK